MSMKNMLTSGAEMQLHYDHPVLFLQHMIWHEGYHHGQMKLALKVAGIPMSDSQAGPLTWSVWKRKAGRPSEKGYGHSVDKGN